VTVLLKRAGEKEADTLELKVSVSDKLSKITELFQEMEATAGYLVYKGKTLAVPEDHTFSKLLAGTSAQFLLCCGESSGSATKWVRFPEYYLTDYYYMNTSYFDAVIFVPKCNIKFHGFGVFANYNNMDCTYIVKWYIDDDKSDEYEIEIANDTKDPEKKWMDINLKELGVKPIKVNEGQKLHCCIKVKSDDYRRCFYGYSGYKDRYSVLPDQDYDFDTEYSSYNDNSTSGDWG